MRISCEIDDPGYVNWARNKKAVVFLNGVEMKYVITADTDEGIVKRYMTNSEGKFVVVNDEAQKETLHGKVVIA